MQRVGSKFTSQDNVRYETHMLFLPSGWMQRILPKVHLGRDMICNNTKIILCDDYFVEALMQLFLIQVK